MAKYAYPAIFTPEDAGISVLFPDIAGCFTSGTTIDEAIFMAQDALCLMLYDMEECGDPIPPSSNIGNISPQGEAFASYIRCDTLEYRKFFDSKAVKKTLTIPSWLNAMAERNDINFSATLQSALKQALQLD